MHTSSYFRSIFCPAYVAGGSAEDSFDLEWSKSGVLAKNFGDQAGDVRSRKAVASHGPLLTIQPGNRHIDPWCAELHRRRGIVIKLVGVLSLEACHRGDRSIE